MTTGVLERYRSFLPVTESTPIFTLGEGNTPLVKSSMIAGEIGCKELYFKLEGCNPTGSFKDRGMVVAVAKAMEARSSAIVCASTGNTSASAAAYGARCGLSTIVLVPKGNVARGKLVQAIVYGARIIMIDGTFDEALKILRELHKETNMTLVNSINPHRLQGQKTAAFEVVDDLGDAPDMLCIPVGNAGNITAYWMGFKEYLAAERSSKLPRMMGFQAEGAAPIVRGHVVENPQTIASAIRIGNPASWEKAVNARDESKGMIDMVTDDQIVEAYKMLSRKEGIFCEPASASSLAGLLKLGRGGMDLRDKKVVCVLTGTGLKDPDLVSKVVQASIEELPSDPRKVKIALTSAL